MLLLWLPFLCVHDLANVVHLSSQEWVLVLDLQLLVALIITMTIIALHRRQTKQQTKQQSK